MPVLSLVATDGKKVLKELIPSRRICSERTSWDGEQESTKETGDTGMRRTMGSRERERKEEECERA